MSRCRFAGDTRESALQHVQRAGPVPVFNKQQRCIRSVLVQGILQQVGAIQVAAL